jgi:oxygen-dependent protoporphyrinogen oxidase
MLQRDDAELIEVVRADLAALTGITARPVDTMVARWGGGLPQYAPGHVERTAAVRAGLPPGLALAGAGFDGVGIPACVASGEAAAESILKHLEDR